MGVLREGIRPFPEVVLWFVSVDTEMNKKSFKGVFGVFVSIIVMALLLSFGFYLYKQTMVDIVANEVAEEVVMTYKFL